MPISSKLNFKEALAVEEILTAPAVAPHPVVPTYAGLDAFDCPPAADMHTYFEAGFRVACTYLSNKPKRIGGGPNHSWINAAPGLSASGWGLAPTYLGAQASLGGSWAPTDPLNQAVADATEAAELAAKAGLHAGQTLFLDVEAPFAAGSKQESYVLKWIESVAANGFQAAMYSFPAMIDWAGNAGIKIWTVHLNSNTGRKDPATGAITWTQVAAPLPKDPIDTGAVGTQGRFYCKAAGLDTALDYDRWTVPDPSNM